MMGLTYENNFTGKEYMKMLNFRNRAEREAFVENYRDWTDMRGKKLGVWKEIPELGLKFYHYGFSTGAVIVVTEFSEYRTAYSGDYQEPGEAEYVTRHKYCLILPENDGYANASHYRSYTLNGCNLWTITDYMTKNKGVI
jgi:hypothetical protein